MALRGETVYHARPGARKSVLLFLIGIAAVVIYATITSESVNLIVNPPLPRNEAIVVFMLTIATLISLTCNIDSGAILSASTFKSGMSACVCVMGVAWLGDTFVKAHLADIQMLAGDTLKTYPWMLALVLFFSSMLLYSQAATAKALLPAALALGVTPFDSYRFFCRRVSAVCVTDLSHTVSRR